MPGSSYRAAGAATLCISTLLSLSAHASPITRRMAHDWSEIAPSSSIAWTPCFDDYSCAKLEVPLDYNDPSIGSTDIAFIKLSAQQDPDSAANLVINNGGPGMSGVGFLMKSRAQLQQAFGSQYNLVSFDPRGVNNSGLTVDCFDGDAAARQQFTTQFFTDVPDASPSAKSSEFNAASTYGKSCSSAFQQNTNAKYISTPAVAHDLLTYAQAENKAIGQPESEAKLWFYAMSYGTVIGTTFSAMFPDNVGRMIMDGVFDDEDYYSGEWTSHGYDSDKAVQWFAKFCFDAGSEACAFWRPSPKKILARLDCLVAKVRNNTEDSTTYSNLMHTLMMSVYAPLMTFPMLAQSLAELEKGNTTSIAASGGFLSLASDSQVLIPCIDSYGLARLNTLEDYNDYASQIISTSKYIGPSMLQLNPRLLCHALDFDLPTAPSFHGPVSSSGKKTAFPILFASNSIDPITPINGATKMAQAFPGSVLLTQENVGHTVIAGASDCYLENIQAYLAGTVPSAETTCDWDRIPFRDPTFMSPM